MIETEPSTRKPLPYRLAERKRLVCAFILLYFAANVFAHGMVQKIAEWVHEKLTPAGTNTLVTVLALLALVLFSVFVFTRVKHAPQKVLKIFYCAATAAFVAVSYTTMFMINTESIHFVQYALLGMLVFMITPRVGETVLLVTILGAIDESYQYWVLDGTSDTYLDFNDMILNLEGAAIGVMLLILLLRENPAGQGASRYSLREFLMSPAFLITAGGTIVALLLFLMGKLGLYNDSGAWIVLRRAGPPGPYWFTSYWGKTCHVLTLWEGVLLMAAMTAFYVFLDFRLSVSVRRP